MKEFKEFLDNMENQEHRIKLENILSWIHKEFPELDMVVKWNQPMFTDHGTFILAFSIAKAHMAFTPEEYGVGIFRDKAESLGFATSKMLIKIKWKQEVNYEFLREVISFNIEDKKDCESFWRK